ncbi:hypothetical protein CERZMDRAFT_89279 [Cercospora zeae-maydis SCOH1-5]|uniref:Transmembrane protein n=1 Tax=Cercospora zeae-maydis SCOH1-5 TaxID=717836 RepID=A0A6A6EYG3_9PEZI|nr:hypothetical protein CERZMDRAFT_89279 [Cercospora zeae-maydis SCOH1-5]
MSFPSSVPVAAAGFLLFCLVLGSSAGSVSSFFGCRPGQFHLFRPHNTEYRPKGSARPSAAPAPTCVYYADVPPPCAMRNGVADGVSITINSPSVNTLHRHPVSPLPSEGSLRPNRDLQRSLYATCTRKSSTLHLIHVNQHQVCNDRFSGHDHPALAPEAPRPLKHLTPPMRSCATETAHRESAMRKTTALILFCDRVSQQLTTSMALVTTAFHPLNRLLESPFAKSSDLLRLLVRNALETTAIALELNLQPFTKRTFQHLHSTQRSKICPVHTAIRIRRAMATGLLGQAFPPEIGTSLRNARKSKTASGRLESWPRGKINIASHQRTPSLVDGRAGEKDVDSRED